MTLRWEIFPKSTAQGVPEFVFVNGETFINFGKAAVGWRLVIQSLTTSLR
jgi:hypothetical protein